MRVPKPNKSKRRRLKRRKIQKTNLRLLRKEARNVFHAYIRKRDSGLPCISCGQYKPLQAGHYVPSGRSSFLRFHEWNVNGECAGCNGFDGFHLVGYRKNLIDKIGINAVVWLELTSHKVHKYTKDELLEIIRKYS